MLLSQKVQTLLLVKKISNNQVALDLDSVTVNGQRFGIQSEDSVINPQADGLGANKRTGIYVGGGAAIGAIIGQLPAAEKAQRLAEGLGRQREPALKS
jgi:hypothetical protein